MSCRGIREAEVRGSARKKGCWGSIEYFVASARNATDKKNSEEGKGGAILAEDERKTVGSTISASRIK